MFGEEMIDEASRKMALKFVSRGERAGLKRSEPGRVLSRRGGVPNAIGIARRCPSFPRCRRSPSASTPRSQGRRSTASSCSAFPG